MAGRTIAYSVSLLALSFATAAVAQDVGESAEGAVGGGDIVVTAQRKEQRLQDVPVSVSIATGESLARNNITDLQDLSVRLPAVRITVAPNANLINVRGVGSGLNPGLEQSVGTFVDGLYRGRSRSSAAALFDLERVEVLKGPQTTYFGNNVIGGALNITTRKPGKEFGFNASALYAPEDEEYSGEAGVDLPVSENLRFRVAGKALGTNGWLSNTQTREREPHRRDWIGRVSMAAEPAENWEVEARVDRGRMRDRGYFAAELIDCPPHAPFPAQPATSLCNAYLGANGGSVDNIYNGVTAYPKSFYNLDFVEAGLTNKLMLGEHTLTSITGYYHHDSDVLSNPIALPYLSPVFANQGALGLFPLLTSEKAEQFSQELRLEGPTGGLIEYTLGAYYGHEKLAFAQYGTLDFIPFGLYLGLPPTTSAAFLIANRQTTNTYSPFAALTVNVTEKLKINLGARYTVVDKDASRTLTYGTALPFASPENFVPFPANQTTAAFPTPDLFFARFDAIDYSSRANFPNPSRSFKRFMPSVNVQYEFTPDISGYASYSNGFKAGGYGLTLKPNSFGSETANAYELGLKASLLDRRLFLTIAAFLSDYKGLQEATQTILAPNGPPGPNTLPPGVDTGLVNVGSARAQGVEMGFSFKASDWLSLNGDVAYLDAKYRNFPNAPCTNLGGVLGAAAGCVGGVQDLAGKRKGFAPEWSGNFGARITVPVNDDIRLTLDPSMYFTSRYFQSSTADPLFEQPGYAKFDLRAAIGSRSGSWEVAVIAKNLTDKKTGSFRNGTLSSNGTYLIATERPRSVAFQVTFKQ